MSAEELTRDERHTAAVDGFRVARDLLLNSPLTEVQQQAVCDMENAAQELNNLYWEA